MKLKPETESRIQALVDSGWVQDADELVLTAVEMMETEKDWLERNRPALEEMMKESLRGRRKEMTDADWEALERRVEERVKRARSRG